MISLPSSLTVSFAHSRMGRAALHAACLLRGRNLRWHSHGILRELFSRARDRNRIASRDRPPRPPHLGAFLLCALLGGGLQVFAFPGAPALDLLPSAQVDGSGIYLHQITKGPTLPAQPIRLADAPAFGQTTSLSREQIRDQVRIASPQLILTNWSGAAQVRVTRRARLLAESELRDLLTATLQQDSIRDRGELELHLIRPWAAVNVPDETLALRILDLPASGISPNCILRFELAAGPERLGPWQVIVQARIWKEVLISRTPLRRGQPLADADLAVERRDVLLLREPLDERTLRTRALELVENVPAGQPILARSLRPKPAVLRGQLVDGLVREGSLNISLKVEVLSDGLPGQTVRVRNPKSKRELYAKVQDEQTVLLIL